MKLGRNDLGPKRPTYQGRNDPHPELAETTQAETTQAEMTRPKRPGTALPHSPPHPPPPLSMIQFPNPGLYEKYISSVIIIPDF